MPTDLRRAADHLLLMQRIESEKMDVTKTFFKEEKNEKHFYSGYSKRVVVSDEENDYRSYESDNVFISVSEDGSVYFSDYNREGGVYIYPDQLEHFIYALDVAKRKRDINASKTKTD